MTERYNSHGKKLKLQSTSEVPFIRELPLFPSPVKTTNPQSTERTLKVLGEYSASFEIVKKNSTTIFGTERQPDSSNCLPPEKGNVFEETFRKENVSRKTKKSAGPSNSLKKPKSQPHPPPQSQSLSAVSGHKMAVSAHNTNNGNNSLPTASKHAPSASAVAKPHQKTKKVPGKGSPAQLGDSRRSQQTPPPSKSVKPSTPLENKQPAGSTKKLTKNKQVHRSTTSSPQRQPSVKEQTGTKLSSPMSALSSRKEKALEGHSHDKVYKNASSSLAASSSRSTPPPPLPSSSHSHAQNRLQTSSSPSPNPGHSISDTPRLIDGMFLSEHRSTVPGDMTAVKKKKKKKIKPFSTSNWTTSSETGVQPEEHVPMATNKPLNPSHSVSHKPSQPVTVSTTVTSEHSKGISAKGKSLTGKAPSQSENDAQLDPLSSKTSNHKVISQTGGTARAGEEKHLGSSKPPKKKAKHDRQLDSTMTVPSGLKGSTLSSSGLTSKGSDQEEVHPGKGGSNVTVSSGCDQTKDELSNRIASPVSGRGPKQHCYVGGKTVKLAVDSFHDNSNKYLNSVDDGVGGPVSSSPLVSKSRPSNLTISPTPGVAVYEPISSSGGIGNIVERIKDGLVTPISGIATPNKSSPSKSSAFSYPHFANMSGPTGSAAGGGHSLFAPDLLPISQDDSVDPIVQSASEPMSSSLMAILQETQVSSSSDDDNDTDHSNDDDSDDDDDDGSDDEDDDDDGSDDDDDNDDDDRSVKSGEMNQAGASHDNSSSSTKLSPTLQRVESIISRCAFPLTPIKNHQKPFQFLSTISTVTEEPMDSALSQSTTSGGQDTATDSDSSSDCSSSDGSESDTESSDDDVEAGPGQVENDDMDTSVNGLFQPSSVNSWQREHTELDSHLGRPSKKRPQTQSDLKSKLASLSSTITVSSSGTMNVPMPATTTSPAPSTLLEQPSHTCVVVTATMGSPPHHGNPVDLKSNVNTFEDLSDQESAISDDMPSDADDNDATLIQTPTSPHSRPPSQPAVHSLTPPPYSSPVPTPHLPLSPPTHLSNLTLLSSDLPHQSQAPPPESLIVSISMSKIKPQNMAIVQPIVVTQVRNRPSRSTPQDDSGPYMRYRSNHPGDDCSHRHNNYSPRRRHRATRSPRWESPSSIDYQPYVYRQRYPPWVSLSADEHLKEARGLKHYGDKYPSESRKKVDYYFRSVLHFMMWAHASELDNRNCAFMYADTANLIEHIMARSGLQALAKEDPIAVLCLRCQANMYFRYFEVKSKRGNSIQQQKGLKESMSKIAMGASSISPYTSSPGAPSPASITSSTSSQSTPGRLDGACSLPTSMVTKAVNHLELFDHFYKSNEAWQLSNEIIARDRDNAKFFANLDQRRGPISQYGPANVVAEWARDGFFCYQDTR